MATEITTYQPHKDAYESGQKACKEGRLETHNPYPPSGHERNTTFSDELWHCWNGGFHNPDDRYDPEVYYED